MVAKRVQAPWVVLMLCLGHCSLGQAVVQFSFNRGDFAISEGGDLPSQLSIIKTGQNVNEMNFIFQVRITPGSARDSLDYIPNNGDPYIFTSSTTQLPIRTQLVGDRAGEPIEDFMICLPDSIMGAETVEPRCVAITIVDDDSVVIGFRSSFGMLEEGGTTTVCADVQREGLRLDPFDRVPLAIQQANQAQSEVQLSTTSLVFENSNTVRCASVSVEDNDNMEGSRSYELFLVRNGASTVPVELYPNTLTIVVIDNDGPDATFSISPQLNFEIQEGGRIENVRIQKSGNTALSYNVSLMVMPLTDTAKEEDVMITKSFLLTPLVTLVDVGPIQIRDDLLSERRKEFSISIGRIEEIRYNIPSVWTAVEGDPVKIIAYDNEYKVGFDVDNFDIMLTRGANRNICVRILDLQPSDIYPMTNIPVAISTSNISAGCIEFRVNQIVLNSTSISRCFVVTATDDIERCDRTKSFIIQLTQIGSSNMDNSITFQGGNISITLQDNPPSSNEVAIAVGITVPLIIIAIVVVIVIIIVFRVVVVPKTLNRKPIIGNYDNQESSSKSLIEMDKNTNDTNGDTNSNTNRDTILSPPENDSPPTYSEVVGELENTSNTSKADTNLEASEKTEDAAKDAKDAPPPPNGLIDSAGQTIDGNKHQSKIAKTGQEIDRAEGDPQSNSKSPTDINTATGTNATGDVAQVN